MTNSSLIEGCPVVRYNHMRILRLRARNHKFAKLINRAFIRSKGFHLSSIASSQTRNFPERNAFQFNLSQRLTAIQHGLVKPSPRTFPFSSRINSKGIENNGKCGETAVCRL
ncbi:hypothetical protein V8G54_017994 [Vigna mungo]|uniref:Uncharacterized protein n=1 Tax=Vigna mungo TaxID=3915 RepID=A0AAQ3N9N2_VIGMU